MSYAVYVLQDSLGRLYKGMTKDLIRRLAEHKRGKTITTRKMTEKILVYKEEYATLNEARKRELYLKSAAGRRFLKQVLEKRS